MTKRKRFLLTFLAWAGGLAGGDRHLLDVAARWREHVDLAVLAPPQAFPMIESFLGDVERLPLGSAGVRAAARGPLLALEYVRRAVSAAARIRVSPDVVVAASHFSPDAVALASLSRRGAFGVGYVYHLIAGRPRNDLRTLWSKTDERIGLALLRRHADLVFASNRLTEEALESRGFAPVRTDVGLDLSVARSRTGDGRPPVGLFLARMVATKGVFDAVKAWALVLDAVPGAKLVMAGDGPLRKPAMKLAEALSLEDSVEWRGFVSEEEKGRLLSQSSLLLAPSSEEGWGISVAEALASGLPVAAYELPVLDELFPSSYLAAPVGDVEALSQAAVQLLTDGTLAAELARHGQAVAQRYDISRIAELELEQILSRAVGHA